MKLTQYLRINFLNQKLRSFHVFNIQLPVTEKNIYIVKF